MQTVTDLSPRLDETMSEREADELAARFQVLADPTRLRLLGLIVGKGEACAACDFAEPLGVSQPTVSHHLRTLYDQGFVEREKRGRWVLYRARPEQFDVLAGMLLSASR
jgi:ArsR family transcriptional regulator